MDSRPEKKEKREKARAKRREGEKEHKAKAEHTKTNRSIEEVRETTHAKDEQEQTWLAAMAWRAVCLPCFASIN